MPAPIDEELVSETKHRLFLALLLVNGSILIAAGGFGYLLAGKTLRPIKQMVDDQHRFISDASHELKTPLTSLKTSFEVYLRDKHKSTKKAEQLITESIAEVDKLQSLSESLLQLTLYKTPHAMNLLRPTSVKKCIELAVKKVQPLATEKQIQIAAPSTSAIVLGNQDSLVQLLVILLDNAIKYSPTKSMVRITVTARDRSVSLTVSDEGPGIEPCDLPHIFDRFYRADQARSTTKQGGYGLGLAIAQNIAEVHSGKLSVRSKPGSGTQFTLHIKQNSQMRAENN